MRSRDPRLPAENELRTLEIRRDPHDVADAASTQIWALYPLASPAEQRPAGPSDVDLLRLVPEVAHRGRRFLALGALVGFLFGAFYLIWTDSIYVVKALLHVELRKSVIRDFDVRPGNTYVGTQAEVIQSPAMVAEAIRAIGLPEEEGGIFATLSGWVGALDPFGSDEEVDPIAQAVLATLPALQASPVLGTDVLAVTLRTAAPERGVQLLDALVASFQHYVRDNETAAHREGLDLLHQREAGLSAQIAELFQVYELKESGIRTLSDSENALTVHRMNLEEHARARVEAQRRRIDLENELASLREQRNAEVAPSREILDELVRQEALLAELKQRLSSRHPDVIQTEQRVAGMREQIRVGGRTRMDELQRAARAARKTEVALASLYESEWEKVKQLESERAGLKKVGDEIARLEEERRGLLTLMGEKELSVLAAQGGENSGTLVRVLQAPSVPPDAVWPLPIPVLISCTFVGVLAGLGFALYRHWRERREVSQPTDYEEKTSRVARRLQEL
jgi:uncharacterized protein involved in exopolysaccharide biosynthesis